MIPNGYPSDITKKNFKIEIVFILMLVNALRAGEFWK